MKTKTITYWTTTVILAFVLLSGAIAHLVRVPGAVEGMLHLGYPEYFMTILGIWKLLGGIVLLAPRFPLVKEWAYAGIFFDMTGAAASHAVCGDSFRHVLVPLLFAGCAVVSWALRPQGRILGSVTPVAWTSASGRVAAEARTVG